MWSIRHHNKYYNISSMIDEKEQKGKMASSEQWTVKGGGFIHNVL